MPLGRDSHIGWAEESAWGTTTVPSKWSELVGESLLGLRTRTPRPIFNGLDPLDDELYDELFGGAGSFTIEALYEGQLRLLEHILGVVNTTPDTPEAGANTHVFTPAIGELHAGIGLSVSVHKGLTQSLRLIGGKVRSATFSFDPTRNTQIALDFVGKDVEEVAETSPTFIANSLLVAGHQTAVEIDDTPRVTDTVEITFDNVLDDAGRELGSKNIREPVRAEKRAVTGTITFDAADADMDKFLAGTNFKLAVIGTGGIIGATATNYGYTLELPAAQITDDPVTVQGPGIVKSTAPFRALKVGAGNVMNLTVISAEAAVA